jgi:putative transposase
MAQMGLRGVSRRKWVTTTVRNPGRPAAPDLVNRQFSSPAPDRLWVADITYIPTLAGFLYLAVVLDAWSRKIVGWAMAATLHTKLVLGALEMAIRLRQPVAVVHHSDHGGQYTSVAFGQRCQDAGVKPSMGSVGDAYDNAMCESFFATLECELLDRTKFATREEAEREVFSFIEGWYNPRRRHSALDYKSPMRYERDAKEAAKNASP